ncbi:MAG TPA: hypothetical protein VFK05_39710 [Polyangiaceae bacterium]|nr:hypothetical protein [Polyangiaceae bacterium]
MKHFIAWLGLGILAYGGCQLPDTEETGGSCTRDSSLACQTGWEGYRCSGNASPSGNCGQPNATTSGFFSSEPGTYCCSTSGAGNPKCDGALGCLAPEDCPSGMYCGCAACGFFCGHCVETPSCGDPNPLGYTLCDSDGHCPNGATCTLNSAGHKVCTDFDKCVAPAAGGSSGQGGRAGSDSGSSGGRGGSGGASGSVTASGGFAGTSGSASGGSAGTSASGGEAGTSVSLSEAGSAGEAELGGSASTGGNGSSGGAGAPAFPAGGASTP